MEALVPNYQGRPVNKEFNIDNTRFTASHRTRATIDKSALDSSDFCTAMRAVGMRADMFINFKPELNFTAYNLLDDEQRAVAARVITSRPQMPTFTLKN